MDNNFRNNVFKEKTRQRAVTLTLALTGLWIVFSKNTILPLPENAGDWFH